MHSTFRTRLRLEDMEGRLVPSAVLPAEGASPAAATRPGLIAPSGTLSTANLNLKASSVVIHIVTEDKKEYNETFTIAGNEATADLAARVGDALKRDGWDVFVSGNSIAVYSKTVNGADQKVIGFGVAQKVTKTINNVPVQVWENVPVGTTEFVSKYVAQTKDNGGTIARWVPAGTQ